MPSWAAAHSLEPLILGGGDCTGDGIRNAVGFWMLLVCKKKEDLCKFQKIGSTSLSPRAEQAGLPLSQNLQQSFH